MFRHDRESGGLQAVIPSEIFAARWTEYSIVCGVAA
jgi:hypothetical protein